MQSIREGYPAVILKAASRFFGVTDARIQEIARVPASTASRLEKSASRIDAAATERVYRMGTVARMAIEVFEDEAAAVDWMCQPNRAPGQHRAAGPDGHRAGRRVRAPGFERHRHRRPCLRLWRIATRKWALDTSCEGARLYGGRWNPVASPAMYAGTTIEICALEKFVHLAGAAHPPLVLVAIEAPDDAALAWRPRMDELPADWAELPAPASTQEFGRRWMASARGLILFVPSAIIPESSNAVLNPRHPAYRDIRLEIVREFGYDARRFKAP